MNEPQHKTVNIGLVERPIPPIREVFDDAYISRLASSIRENGLMQPIMVRPRGDKFEVIDGDCRLKACWDAGLRQVPVLVFNLDDRETHIQRMLANKDRADTDPVSEAKYIARLVHDKVFTAEEYAEKIGRSINWISDRLTIAEMPEYMQTSIAQGMATLGVCLELHQIHDANTKERYFREAIRNGMTVHTAKINRLMVNEALDALAENDQVPTEDTLPPVQIVPKVKCDLTGEVLPVSATRMIRVGIENWKRFQEASVE